MGEKHSRLVGYEDAISETEFVNAIEYLIKVGIIGVESSKSPELIAEMWVNGDINDDEFLTNVEQLIETGNVSIPDNSVTKTSQLPDWLVNNAGWWAARIITNSDFNFDPGYTKEELYPCIRIFYRYSMHSYENDTILMVFAAMNLRKKNQVIHLEYLQLGVQQLMVGSSK